jgi:HAD superfamily hydrolase (TIGR01458 family)
MTARPVILDMEGVIHVGWSALPGSVRALERLREAAVELAILTNTTGLPRTAIGERLRRMGIAVSAERIVTAASATADHVRTTFPGRSVCLLGERGAAAEFAGVALVDQPGDAGVLVLSGPDESLTPRLLNAAFRALSGGVPLIAMQRNRWWPTADGPAMDAGGYVAALEYAADVRAEVIGKPSAQIYRAALAACGADPGSATMVGDDLVSDLRPAAALGMATCLVRTGKGGSFDPAPGEIDLDVPDLAAFVDLLLS